MASSDFSIASWPSDIGPKPYAIIRTKGWWNLRKGDIKPYLTFEIWIEGVKYRFCAWPNRPDSYPTAKIIRRELLRESAVRSMEGGILELEELPEKEDE